MTDKEPTTKKEPTLEELAAARLAKQTPSNTRQPHCWFCGKIEAWFQCDCKDARDAQAGKRNKPYFDAKRGVMVLDPEIIQRNIDNGWFTRRYVPPEKKPTVDSVDTPPVDPSPIEVDKSAQAVDPEAGDSVDPKPDRKRYQAEWARQHRPSRAKKDDSP